MENSNIQRSDTHNPSPDSDDRHSLIRMFLRRLRSNRYPVAVATGLFAVLYVAGSLSLLAVLACVVAVIAAFGAAPVGIVAASPEERQPEVPLAHDRKRSDVLLDSLPDPILLLDSEGTVRSLNAASRQVFNNTIQPGSSALTRFRNPELLSMIKRALAGETPEPVEIVERYPIERWFQAAIVALPAEWEDDEPFLLYLRDLSEMHRLDRMRSDFIANASHELRTPLASLSGFIETLSGPARNDATARDRFLAIMQEQANRMSRLIDDLLSLSRLETASGRTEFQLLNIAEVLRHVAASLASQVEEVDVTLNVDFDAVEDPGCRVRGSRDELIQVFSNLLENAIRYAATGKMIDFHAERVDDGGAQSVRVIVRDYGPGIAEDHIPRLTERFYRVDVESSRAKKGTGLGLAIVKHILTRHRGRLSISSVPGRGASFVATLPTEPVHEASGRQKRR